MGLNSSRMPADAATLGAAPAAAASSIAAASNSVSARRPLPTRGRVHSHLQASNASTTAGSAAGSSSASVGPSGATNATNRNRSRSLMDILTTTPTHAAAAAAAGGSSRASSSGIFALGEEQAVPDDAEDTDDEPADDDDDVEADDDAGNEGDRHPRRSGRQQRRLVRPPAPPPRQSRSRLHQQQQRQHALMLRHLGLPVSFYRADIRCPVCGKTVPSDDTEVHLVMCLTRPKITYNEDVLDEDRQAECAICLDELCQGDTIARLPCLCIYHKGCIDDWFKRSRTCPQHPDDG